jgi:hypothetical protein
MFDQDIVGEQHYQDVLIRIAGPYSKERKRIHCEAVLYLQPDNPHDSNAIRVEIEGYTVGYIPREQAPVLRRQLRQIGIMEGHRVEVDAIIGGGLIGQRYGVYLDFDVPDEPQVSAQPLQQYLSQAEWDKQFTSVWADPQPHQPPPPRTTMPKWEEKPQRTSQIASVWANQPTKPDVKRPWWRFW